TCRCTSPRTWSAIASASSRPPARIAGTAGPPTGPPGCGRGVTMRVSATAKYLRGSTRKARLITEAIKGMPVEDAAAALRFMPQTAAKDVARVLKSATANAENNLSLSADDLYIADAFPTEGPPIKRWRPRAQGRAFPIHKPMTHITITVADREA